MGQRLKVAGKLKPIGEGAAKASLNRAMRSLIAQSAALDPKPGDLAMRRMKVR